MDAIGHEPHRGNELYFLPFQNRQCMDANAINDTYSDILRVFELPYDFCLETGHVHP